MGLKICGETPGDWADNKKAVSRIKELKQSPNKKDWGGGPGKLSRAELIKYRRTNLQKANEKA